MDERQARKIIKASLFGCGIMTRAHLIECVKLAMTPQQVDRVLDILIEEKLIVALLENSKTVWYADQSWMEDRR